VPRRFLVDIPVVTHDFVRTLTKKIRATFGKDVPHTQVLDLIAESLNWRTDALMHKLKSSADTKPGREAPDSVSDETLRQWVVLRSWRRAEQACADRRAGDATERAMISACLAVCRVALGDVQGAYDAMANVTSLDPMVSLTRSLILYKKFGDAPPIRDELWQVARTSAPIRDITRYPRSPDVGDLNMRITATEIGYGSIEFWELHLEEAFSHLAEPGFLGLAYRMFLEAHDIIPEVRVEKSVGRDTLVCLFDGERRRRLKSYLETKYGMTPDDYRAYWGLSADYPMVAPGNAAELP
jgi:hypothetical protein